MYNRISSHFKWNKFNETVNAIGENVIHLIQVEQNITKLTKNTHYPPIFHSLLSFLIVYYFELITFDFVIQMKIENRPNEFFFHICTPLWLHTVPSFFCNICLFVFLSLKNAYDRLKLSEFSEQSRGANENLIENVLITAYLANNSVSRVFLNWFMANVFALFGTFLFSNQDAFRLLKLAQIIPENFPTNRLGEEWERGRERRGRRGREGREREREKEHIKLLLFCTCTLRAGIEYVFLIKWNRHMEQVKSSEKKKNRLQKVSISKSFCLPPI